jgi:hypothetical protein
VLVSDPIGSGGDRDMLSTVYLADKGLWQRIGARTAGNSDLPSAIKTFASGDDNFAFSDYAALRRPHQDKTYLVTSRDSRVANGFDGYRVQEIDRAAMILRPIDKWNGEGAKVYGAFKRSKDPRGYPLFKLQIESKELLALCEESAYATPGLAAECKRLKR